MELEPSDWISIVSLLVNVVLLIVTMREVRSAWAAHSKQMRQQFFTDYTKRYQEIIRNFPEDVNEPDFQLYQNRGTERGDERFEKTMRAMRTYFDLCFEEWSLHESKELDDAIWNVWKGGMATAFQKPAFQQAWQRITRPHDTNYGDAFKAFVDRLMDPARSIPR